MAGPSSPAYVSSLLRYLSPLTRHSVRYQPTSVIILPPHTPRRHRTTPSQLRHLPPPPPSDSHPSPHPLPHLHPHPIPLRPYSNTRLLYSPLRHHPLLRSRNKSLLPPPRLPLPPRQANQPLPRRRSILHTTETRLRHSSQPRIKIRIRPLRSRHRLSQ